jgi:hypothetical protein
VLVHAGASLAHVPLELCGRREASIYDSTPCARSPHRRTASTDADGAFVFDALADGGYQIFILEQPFHTQTLVLDVKGGEHRDIGRFEVHTTTDRSP